MMADISDLDSISKTLVLILSETAELRERLDTFERDREDIDKIVRKVYAELDKNKLLIKRALKRVDEVVRQEEVNREEMSDYSRDFVTCWVDFKREIHKYDRNVTEYMSPMLRQAIARMDGTIPTSPPVGFESEG